MLAAHVIIEILNLGKVGEGAGEVGGEGGSGGGLGGRGGGMFAQFMYQVANLHVRSVLRTMDVCESCNLLVCHAIYKPFFQHL